MAAHAELSLVTEEGDIIEEGNGWATYFAADITYPVEVPAEEGPGNPSPDKPTE